MVLSIDSDGAYLVEPGVVDYSSKFPTASLPRIVGRPNYLKLKDLKKFLQTGALGIQSDLGGGAHGHLGLVLDDATYQAISGGIPYIRPPHPGVLEVPAGTAHHEAVRFRDEHQTNLKLHRETHDVEATMREIIMLAVEHEWLQAIMDPELDTLTGDIPTILAYLFLNYGQLDQDFLDKEEKTLDEFVWNPNDHINVVFNAIDKYQKYYNQVGDPRSDSTLIRLGIKIINKTGEMETAILEWEVLSAVEYLRGFWVVTYVLINRYLRQLHREREIHRLPRQHQL